MPPDSVVGFAPADWALIFLAALLLLAAFARTLRFRGAFDSIAHRPRLCVTLLWILPIAIPAPAGASWSVERTASGAFCAACYWMLRGYVSPAWALLGGLLAVTEFGPLSQWTNSYNSASLAAIAGCLLFGSLPRLRANARPRDAILLGLGVALHLLVLQIETLFLLLTICLWMRKSLLRVLPYAAAPVLLAALLLLFQAKAMPHFSYTHVAGFLSAPLYVALIAFFFSLRSPTSRRIAASLAIFALGTYFLPHMPGRGLASVSCLFLLVAVTGLQVIRRIRVNGTDVGLDIALVLIVLCLGEFIARYTFPHYHL